MKNTNQNHSNVKDSILWLGVVTVTLAAFFCTYYYNISGPTKSLIWLVWFVATLGLAYLTTLGQTVFSFMQEARIELLKVVWPTRQETVQTTTIVMVMVTVTGFILWGIDSVMIWAIAKLTHLG